MTGRSKEETENITLLGKIEKPKLRKIYGADKLVAMENKA